MAELVKPWNDGGSLSVAYEGGDGDGSAVFFGCGWKDLTER